ncbi:hypothetical protein BCV69DRAFT_284745 [Microstroma glucosiphilum]|uniref:Uncharacterized protein n=1 Tax=Pseudomicrostroma glucosiphilum TaxID=1684307 RepID=A0A316U0M7_9BASI|nr:hypothetical protein BCV69DRAFT_284745 [Pseudomicrostroma glucosiphilum]PWN18760.1 hypothetical protein BCV69DRAFT_284745 [Pseudomicrostroma glucosiphilum]
MSSMEPSTNVFSQPLAQCSTQPLTGFFRDGYCNTAPADGGSHTLAAQVTPEFLEFSKSRGNDLTSILSGGCKWCLCVTRWKEALTAYRSGEVGRSAVPSVILPATHQLALKSVTLQDLQEFSIDKQGGSGNAPDPSAGGPIR